MPSGRAGATQPGAMGLPLPDTLTPSKLASFVSCPLSFRFAYLDRLPELPSPQLVRGTLVHRVLQLLFSSGPPDGRTPERVKVAFAVTWEALLPSEIAALGLGPRELGRFEQQARDLLDRYLSMEDPASVHAIGIELDLRAEIEGIELRGIIDRLDLLPNGDLAVVDYKTGRAPRPEQTRARMTALLFYALLCELALGKAPSELRLMYLGDGVVVTESPTEQSLRGVRQRALAVWRALERACGTGDFRAHPSPLCRSCTYRHLCPATGGEPGAASRAVATAG